jgi:cytochrome c oxidase subunit IV
MVEQRRGWGTAPAGVAIAAMIGLVKAVLEGVLGILGLAVADEVGDGFAGILLAYAVVFAAASFLLLRGSRIGLIVTALLSAAGLIGAVVYMFAGPASAIVSCVVVAGFNALVLVLLFRIPSSREYFRRG